MSVERAFNETIQAGASKTCPTRIKPTRSYLRHFCRAKGHKSLATASISVFDGSLGSIREFIERTAFEMEDYGLRNYKNNVTYFVREGRKRATLPSPTGDLVSDYARGNTPKGAGKAVPANAGLHVGSYILKHNELEEAPTFAGQLRD